MRLAREEFGKQPGEHSWCGLEHDFQQLLAASSSEPQREREALLTVLPYLRTTAGRLLAAMGVSNRHHDAENAVQDWCVAIARKEFRFRAGRPAHRYAYGMLRNICLSLARRVRRLKPLPPDFDRGDDRFDPLHGAAQREATGCVQRSLEALAPPLRRAIYDQFMEGLSAKESAQKEGITEGAVGNRRYRAREELRRLLRRPEGLDGGPGKAYGT